MSEHSWDTGANYGVFGRGRTRPNLTKAQKLKTELCRNVTEKSYCRYENRCLFAHSLEELRLRPTNPRFRKEKCTTYHEEGFCAYGSRCSFLHENKEELAARLDKLVEEFWRKKDSGAGKRLEGTLQQSEFGLVRETGQVDQVRQGRQPANVPSWPAKDEGISGSWSESLVKPRTESGAT